jgi:hypothetical protein
LYINSFVGGNGGGGGRAEPQVIAGSYQVSLGVDSQLTGAQPSKISNLYSGGGGGGGPGNTGKSFEGGQGGGTLNVVNPNTGVGGVNGFEANPTVGQPGNGYGSGGGGGGRGGGGSEFAGGPGKQGIVICYALLN